MSEFLAENFQFFDGEIFNIFVVNKLQSEMTKLLTCVPNGDSNQLAIPRSLTNLRCPHEETFYPWLSKMHQVKIKIRLRERAG